ncbi:MAG TPA: Gfo/Idh/MocA family oxidoreductase [Verrucomicrobiae bacterium]|nr:Gfo/Idh/MocA family oxidoreductase [Verrucomicrobiae bacterium]
MNRRQFVTTTAAAFAGAAATNIWAQEKTAILAFVGCAHIHTPSFIKLLNSRNDVKTKWVWDHDAARAEKRAKELSAQVVSDVEKIWADPEVSAVVICSETTRHHDLVLAAAKAGKHMFVEKPLGITARESEAMAAAIQKAGLHFTTGYFMRTDPKHLFLKEQVAQGNFGKITRVRGSNCHAGSLRGYFDSEWRWMADPKIAGVGAFGDLGTHKLDILMWLFGDVEEVSAQVEIVTNRYKDCDETGEALMQFKNGIIGTLAAGWVDVDDPVQLIISGTEGHATIVNNELYYKSNKVSGADGKKPFKELPSAPQLPLHQFVNAVAGKKDQPLVTPAEAAARVKVMETMYKAARSRKWLKVA